MSSIDYRLVEDEQNPSYFHQQPEPMSLAFLTPVVNWMADVVETTDYLTRKVYESLANIDYSHLITQREVGLTGMAVAFPVLATHTVDLLYQAATLESFLYDGTMLPVVLDLAGMTTGGAFTLLGAELANIPGESITEEIENNKIYEHPPNSKL